MAIIALTNGIVHVGGHDFTCDVNQMTMEMTVAELDVTTMCSDGWTQMIGGVKSSSLNVSGFWQSDGDNQVDDVAFADLGVVGRPVTIGHTNTEGSVIYMTQMANINYSMFGAHGEAAPFTLTASGSNSDGTVQGRLLAEKQDVSSTGALGSGTQAGAVAADEYLYASLHCFSAGTTFDAVVESDDNSGFTSATTRVTFSGITTEGGTWATKVAGAITDDWWRVRVTTCTGTFSIAASIGIG